MKQHNDTRTQEENRHDYSSDLQGKVFSKPKNREEKS